MINENILIRSPKDKSKGIKLTNNMIVYYAKHRLDLERYLKMFIGGIGGIIDDISYEDYDYPCFVSITSYFEPDVFKKDYQSSDLIKYVNIGLLKGFDYDICSLINRVKIGKLNIDFLNLMMLDHVVNASYYTDGVQSLEAMLDIILAIKTEGRFDIDITIVDDFVGIDYGDDYGFNKITHIENVKSINIEDSNIIIDLDGLEPLRQIIYDVHGNVSVVRDGTPLEGEVNLDLE